MAREANVVARFRERIEGRKAKGDRPAVPAIPGVVVYKNHGGRFSLSGRPDIEVVFRQRWAEPRDPAITVFIEFKAPGKHPTAIQLIEMARLREAGAIVTWTDSVDTAIAFLVEHGLPERPGNAQRKV
jgi:hypothetical protein